MIANVMMNKTKEKIIKPGIKVTFKIKLLKYHRKIRIRVHDKMALPPVE